MRIPFWSRPPVNPVMEQFASTLATLKGEQLATLMETANLMANFVDPRERFEGPNGERWMPLGSNQDGRSASDKSNFTTEQELTDAREECRLLAACNPYAINLHENMISYVVGEGHKYSVVAKQGEDVGDEILKSAQTAIEEWCYEVRWADRQKEMVRRYDRDGEVFLRFSTRDDGTPDVRFVEPNQVKQPDGNRTDLFGVIAEPDDVENVTGYWIDGQTVDAKEIQHRKANVDANVRRGVPTTWPIAPFLTKAVHVLNNIAKVSIIQTKIALIQRYVGATRAGLESMRAEKASTSYTDPTDQKMRYVEQMPDGAIVRSNANTEWEYPAGGLDINNFGGGAQFLLRTAAARVCFPEFMFTSDASNANYASTMVAEGPAVRMFQRRQAVQRDADLEVIWRVLEAKLGENAAVLDSIEIQVESPTVQVRDAKAEADVNKIYADMRILSPQTITGSIGHDYEQEQKNIEEHEKDHPPKVDPLDQARIAAMGAGGMGEGDPLASASLKARESVGWGAYP